jgi:hypothetical protein
MSPRPLVSALALLETGFPSYSSRPLCRDVVAVGKGGEEGGQRVTDPLPFDVKHISLLASHLMG